MGIMEQNQVNYFKQPVNLQKKPHQQNTQTRRY